MEREMKKITQEEFNALIACGKAAGIERDYIEGADDQGRRVIYGVRAVYALDENMERFASLPCPSADGFNVIK